MEDPSLSFAFPDPDELRPPLITLDLATVGYGETPILKRLNLRIDPDDRIALLGRNGNGKTTMARLLAAQLTPMDGSMQSSSKMRVGYFTQYQVEELASDDTPLAHMTRAMEGKPQGAVRAQLGRFGFSGHLATSKVAKLSGGERARLALALITRDAPHLLILDEPTNHLDVDAREALVQALNDYTGAVIMISHDRHMVELTADRLVLVDHGTAEEYPGSIQDYIDYILGRKQPKSADDSKGQGGQAKPVKRAHVPREKLKAAQKAVTEAEREMTRVGNDLAGIDEAIADSTAPGAGSATHKLGDLSRRRSELTAALKQAEQLWLEASEALEQLVG